MAYQQPTISDSKSNPDQLARSVFPEAVISVSAPLPSLTSSNIGAVQSTIIPSEYPQLPGNKAPFTARTRIVYLPRLPTVIVILPKLLLVPKLSIPKPYSYHNIPDSASVDEPNQNSNSKLEV